MKLRNKKTGEIIEFKSVDLYAGYGNKLSAESLAELNSEWEDYEEPKEYWYIENNGDIDKETYDGDAYEEKMIEIGNYFETEEQAEKAVEKLKAWKRLKDKGFRFIEGWLDNNDDFIVKAKLGTVGLIDQPDVHLLFGDENE